ncbi:MAG: phosphoserine phosphatase SerB [Betaproteobacteria bacterium]|nr:phosphoserine phosphatase SerB [Betaproteobacteria bacterium]
MVIQGRSLDDAACRTIGELSGATQCELLVPGAARLHAPLWHDGVAAACAALSLDHAFVPRERRLADFRLIALDMDSTLITIECIDEIAHLQGIKPQVAAITEAAMRGELDYPESLRRRVALLQGMDASALARVYEERLRLSPGAERMLAALQSLGIRTLLVSGGFTFFTERLKARLALDYAGSNTLGIADGRLTGTVLGPVFDGEAKAAKIREVRDALGLERDQIIAIGDGANDLKMMAEAGISIAWRAKPVVQQQASCAFNHVGLDGLLNLFR